MITYTNNNNDNNRIYNKILDRDWFSTRLLLLGSLRNDSGNAKVDGWKNNGLKFYLWISQLSRTVLHTERSKTLLKLKM